MLVGERAACHQRRDHRQPGELGQLAKDLGSARCEDSSAGVDDGPRRLVDQARGILDLLRVALRSRPVAREVDAIGPVPVHRRVRDVLREVDQDRARTARRCDMERLADHTRDVLRVADEPVVLRDRHRYAGRVGLLEGIGAYRRVRDLTGDDHEGNGVHVRVAECGDDVRGGRATGHHRDAGAARDVCVARRHVPRALLVADEDVPDRRVDERVVDGEDRPAREAEHHLDPLHLEALDEGLGPGHLHGLAPWVVAVSSKKNPPPWARGRRSTRARAGAPCAM